MTATHADRIHDLNDRPIRDGKFVIYWMQASQRAEWNHALEYAINQANQLGLPLLVYFGLTDAFPGANLRHYNFMIEGLIETEKKLAARGIQMVFMLVSPPDGLKPIAGRAALVVADVGYTRVQRAWRELAAQELPCRLMAIESDVAVPVQSAYPKEAYSAAVIRPKIRQKLHDVMVPLRSVKLQWPSIDMKVLVPEQVSLVNALDRLRIDRSVRPIRTISGGASHANRLLKQFIDKKLASYDESRNDPTTNGTSHLSPYLHFGQISPLYIALKVSESKGEGAEAFLEELVVRRELSMNFAWYNSKYDSFECLPAWAKQTLHKHASDKRSHVYSADQWEQALTHDPCWNAAQRELLYTGRIHGYMRMYWGKKILEWSGTPEEAYQTAVYLNDKYQLDGRDPNGYAGIAWCFGKHDRPWAERPVFGLVRYMNAVGLRRKFNADAYVRQIDQLAR
jgi:deoxyribodipyrimidine photo-lyase